jgi:hypothetical protein
MKSWVKLIIAEVVFLVLLYAGFRIFHFDFNLESFRGSTSVELALFDDSDDMWYVGYDADNEGWNMGYHDHTTCPPAPQR